MNQFAPPRPRSGARPTVVVDGPVGLADFDRVCRGEAVVRIGHGAALGLRAAEDRLAAAVAEDRLVYGITTGFGPLADRSVGADRIETLQKNLIYHLASGVGRPFGAAEARALMFARLLSIAQGWSGASGALVALLVDCLNAGLAAHVPEKGTVGASGDLTPSAHIALALMGEGAFLGPDGTSVPAAAALAAHGIAPYTLQRRDGLALVNGTSCMTGIAALNAVEAGRLLETALRLSVAHAEAMRGRIEAWHPAFGLARPHPGQRRVLARLAALADGSGRIARDRVAERRVPRGGDIERLPAPPQDPYTIRCVPQILGAIADMLDHHDAVVSIELNAATDNPIFDAEAPHALHGGNFYGQHVGFVSDALTAAVTKLAVLSERQIARLTDERQSGGFPAFLQGDRTGLQSGFMGAQVTATALVAEMRTRAVPASIQSIPTNANNQDVVSLGTVAARNARAVIGDAAHVLAIQALVVAQAMDVQPDGWSPAARGLHAAVRAVSPPLGVDRPLSADIAAVAATIAAGGLAA